MSGVRAFAVLGLCLSLMGVGPPATADSNLTNFPWTSTVMVPPGGMGYTGSPTVPPKATRITVTVAIDGGPLSTIATVLAVADKRTRLLYCASLGAATLGFPENDTENRMLGLSLTLACFQMMTQMAQVSQATTAGCPGVVLRAPMTMQRNGAAYVPTLTGPPTAARSTPLRVKCRMAAGSMKMTIRTRKHKSLRRYVGPRLFLGFLSPTTAPAPVEARVTYAKVR